MLNITIERREDKEYKVVDDTCYEVTTPDKVIEILERSRINKIRIRVFYGFTERTGDSFHPVGKDWNEEHDTIGCVGRSTGRVKIPILLKRVSSYGGGCILEHSIVRITIDKQNVYCHPNYDFGTWQVVGDYEVLRDGQQFAKFDTLKKAMNFIKFMKGLRNRI